MAKKKKTTEEMIEDLAVMVQRGFAETANKEDIKRLEDRLDRIEFSVNGHERRIETLEDKVRMLSVKVGFK
ncbi:MAG TPA: hypothetical protein VJH55_01505 [Candidatus Paceibacterota bacterium]